MKFTKKKKLECKKSQIPLKTKAFVLKSKDILVISLCLRKGKPKKPLSQSKPKFYFQ
jgi:hypothetical protein